MQPFAYDFQELDLIKIEDKVEGITVCAQVVKNKLAPASMKKAELGIKFGRGFCQESEVFDLACEHGFIMKDDRNYFIEGENFSSREAAELFLAKNKRICDKLVMDMKRPSLKIRQTSKFSGPSMIYAKLQT